MTYTTQDLINQLPQEDQELLAQFAARMKKGIAFKLTHPTISEKVRFEKLEILDGDKTYFTRFCKLLDRVSLQPDIYMAILMYMVTEIFENPDGYTEEKLLSRLDTQATTSNFLLFLQMFQDNFPEFYRQQYIYGNFFAVGYEDWIVNYKEGYRLSDTEWEWLNYKQKPFSFEKNDNTESQQVADSSTKPKRKLKQDSKQKKALEEAEMQLFEATLSKLKEGLIQYFLPRIKFAELLHVRNPDEFKHLIMLVYMLGSFFYHIYHNLKEHCPHAFTQENTHEKLITNINFPIFTLVVAADNPVVMDKMPFEALLSLIDVYRLFSQLSHQNFFSYELFARVKACLMKTRHVLSVSDITLIVSHYAVPLLLVDSSAVDKMEQQRLFESALKRFVTFCELTQSVLMGEGSLQYLNDIFLLAALFLFSPLFKHVSEELELKVKRVILDFTRSLTSSEHKDRAVKFESLLYALDAKLVVGQVQELKIENNELQQRLKAVLESNVALHMEKGSLAKELKKAQDELRRREAEFKQRENELEQERSELKQAQENLETDQAKVDQYRKDLKNTQAAAIAQKNSFEGQISKLETTIAKLKRENESQIKTIKTKIAKLQEERDTLKKGIEDHRSVRRDLEEQLCSIKLEAEELARKLAEVKHTSEKAIQTAAKVVREKASETPPISVLSGEGHKVDICLADLNSDLIATVSQLQKDCTRLQQQLISHKITPAVTRAVAPPPGFIFSFWSQSFQAYQAESELNQLLSEPELNIQANSHYSPK